jgi:hypothetical protein
MAEGSPSKRWTVDSHRSVLYEAGYASRIECGANGHVQRDCVLTLHESIAQDLLSPLAVHNVAHVLADE